MFTDNDFCTFKYATLQDQSQIWGKPPLPALDKSSIMIIFSISAWNSTIQGCLSPFNLKIPATILWEPEADKLGP